MRSDMSHKFLFAPFTVRIKNQESFRGKGKKGAKSVTLGVAKGKTESRNQIY